MKRDSPLTERESLEYCLTKRELDERTLENMENLKQSRIELQNRDRLGSHGPIYRTNRILTKIRQGVREIVLVHRSDLLRLLFLSLLLLLLFPLFLRSLLLVLLVVLPCREGTAAILCKDMLDATDVLLAAEPAHHLRASPHEGVCTRSWKNLPRSCPPNKPVDLKQTLLDDCLRRHERRAREGRHLVDARRILGLQRLVPL